LKPICYGCSVHFTYAALPLCDNILIKDECFLTVGCPIFPPFYVDSQRSVHRKFEKNYPKQYFDVGIAEQHAITFAGGLATQGLKPIVAIYSTFLQRGYDQLIHDIALQNLNVIFAIDRAGLVGSDGATLPPSTLPASNALSTLLP
jgi:hypothetical protein